MSDNGRPWFKFSPRDFLSDEKVQALSLESVGAYTILLCVLWKSSDGRIPNDNNAIQNIIKCDNGTFKKIWFQLMPENPKRRIFKTETDDYGDEWIYSKRLDDERRDVIERSEKAKQAVAERERKKNERSSNDPSNDDRTIIHAEAEADAEADIAFTSVKAAQGAGHYSNYVKSDQVIRDIQSACELIKALSGDKVNGYALVQKAIQDGFHQLAVCDAVCDTARQYPKGFKKTPAAFLKFILNKREPIRNEQDAVSKSNGYKQIKPSELLKQILPEFE